MKTQHKVKGMVYTLNDNVIVIENFVYDGRGFGVHVNVGELSSYHNVTYFKLDVAKILTSVATTYRVKVERASFYKARA